MIIQGKEYEINRKTAVVSKWDKIYCQLVERILSEGELIPNRTGVDTYSVDTATFTIDLSKDGFPILESKKVNIRNALSEILWIYQAQSNQVSWLQKRGNHIWDEWEIDADGIYRIYDPKNEFDPLKEVVVKDLDGQPLLDEHGQVMKTVRVSKKCTDGKTIKEAIYFGKEFAGTIGTAYGWINNKYGRPQYVLQQLKENPYDRRMVISLWQDAHIKTGVLPPCVWSNTWKVSKGKLNVLVNQRSCDVPLGLPFNVSQYAILLALFAKVSGYEVGNLTFSIADAHIYENQVEQMKLQLSRYKRMEKFETLIASFSDEKIEKVYKALKQNIQILESKSELNQIEQQLLCDTKEDLLILELMITKEQPVLELADKNDFFEFSNEVNLDKEYLKENMTGNEDIKVKKYAAAPFIKMPITQ